MITGNLQGLRRFEKGQAFAIVLILLAIGSLTIAVNLNYASDSLKSGTVTRTHTAGYYSASAGIESVLWAIETGNSAPSSVSGVNGMQTNMQSTLIGEYTFYLGGMVSESSKSDVLTVTSNISSRGGNDYEYSITIYRTAAGGAQTLHLSEVGARIPAGYSYNGTATRSDGEYAGAPAVTGDNSTGYILNWSWNNNDRPVLVKEGDTFTLTFYISGTGTLEGQYAWTMADPSGYGLYGEISGSWYHIISTAVNPANNRTVSQITADVVKLSSSGIKVLSWQITK